MTFIHSIFSLFKEALAGPLRHLRAVREHPTARIMPGAWVGPGCCFGRNVVIYRGAIVARTTIGDHSYIGGDSLLQNCTVGRFCSIAPSARIGLGMHPTDRVSTYRGFYSASASAPTRFYEDTTVQESLPVTLGHDIWVGAGAILMDGINIGNGAVIAAGAVVTADVAPYDIVGGVPARVIRARFSTETVTFLQGLCWWNKDDEWLRRHAPLFADPDALRAKMESEQGTGTHCTKAG